MRLSCNHRSLASLQEPFGSSLGGHSKNVQRDQPQPLWRVLSQIFVPAQSRCSSPRCSNEAINLWGQLLAFLSYSSLQQIAKDHRHELPQAANAILRDFYVDYCISGASSIEEAISLGENLCALIGKGEMTLQKWRSNCQTVIDSIPESLRETCNDSDLLFPQRL